MKVALLITARNDWDSVLRLLAQVGEKRAAESEVEWSVWIVDDGSAEKPPSWNALSTTGLERMHVIELHGTYGRERSLAIGLGYLVMEAQEACDAYILLCGSEGWENASAQLPLLLAAHDKDSQCALVAQRARSHRYYPPPLGALLHRLLFRCCTGQYLHAGELLLMPPHHAEALCHSAHAGNHLAAAMAKLRLPLRSLPLSHARALRKSSRTGLTTIVTDSLNAIAVFREAVFARVLILALALATAAFSATLLAWGKALPAAWAWPALLACTFFLAFACAALFLSLGALSLREMRLWTPALDSATLIRCVNRVRRAPYPVSSTPTP